MIVTLDVIEAEPSAMAASTSHKLTRIMTQSGRAAVVTQISTSSQPAIGLATHFLHATEGEDTSLSPNFSLPSPSPSTSTSYEGQDSTHVSFNRTRTIIAVLVAILIFASIVVLLLCLGTRGRGNATGEGELPPVNAPSVSTRRQAVLQSSLPPVIPSHYPLRPWRSNPTSSWSQPVPTNRLLPQNRLDPATDTSPLTRLIPQGIRDRYPRLPFTGVLLPEVPSLFHVSTPSPARAPRAADSVTQPNTYPLGIYSPDLPNYNVAPNPNPPSNGRPYLPSAV